MGQVLGIPDILGRIRIRLLSSVTLRMPKKIFHYFFLIIFQQTHYLQSLIYCFKDKFWVKILFCKHYFSPLNTFMKKGMDPDPYLWLTDPNPGGPKTCGSQHWEGQCQCIQQRFRSGSMDPIKADNITKSHQRKRFHLNSRKEKNLSSFNRSGNMTCR